MAMEEPKKVEAELPLVPAVTPMPEPVKVEVPIKGEKEEDYLDQVSGLPIRFSYENLKVATKNFSKKIGDGGFG
ncbi:hypothetical protein LguiB_002041 [Lonicera macranthoides]